MSTTAIIFLLIAGAIALVATNLSTQKSAQTGLSAWNKRPTWPERSKWPRIKTMWMEWYVRCQKTEAPRRNATFSGCRTIVLCAAICLMGTILKLEHDEQGSVSRICSDCMHTFSAAVQSIQFRNAR